MSGFSVGAQVATVDNNKNVTTAEKDKSVPGTFVKWIPGEAVTFYTALLGVGAAQSPVTGKETPDELLARINAGSVSWFLTGAAVAIAFVVFGALAEKDQSKKIRVSSLVVRCLLTVVSFSMWATAMPGSWPYGWHLIRDMGAAYALLLVPMAALFAALADLLTTRLKL